jgi:hypothetical protein
MVGLGQGPARDTDPARREKIEIATLLHSGRVMNPTT